MSDVVEKTVEATVKHPEGSPADTLSKLKNMPPEHLVNKEVTFSFKATTDKDTKEKIPARPALSLLIPYPTWDGVLESLTDENSDNGVNEAVRSYVIRLIHDDITAAARQQVSDPERPVTKQEELAINKLTIQYLAAQPESERRGGGIAAEVWASFEDAYIKVMTSKAGKDLEKATNAAKIFVKRFLPVRTRKPVIEFLRGELDKFFDAADEEQQEEFADVYEFLKKKADDLLKMDDESLLQNL